MLWVLALLLAAVATIWLGLRLRRTTGLPWARVVASDAGGRTLDKPLFVRRYGLTGRPDYLLEQGRALIPVEVKPGRQADRPYESDLMQLAAYCLLVEETSGAAPPYGLLRYAHHTFRMPYTDAVREELLALLDEMRDALNDDDCERSHDDAGRCAGCGFVEVCDEALVR
ncbi:MAG: CRISPR-associated protein Cas4 [Chloroflexales bacterium]|nr:CRISPR-associated protein Cas4 [Chloroflexales bacterium]